MFMQMRSRPDPGPSKPSKPEPLGWVIGVSISAFVILVGGMALLSYVLNGAG